MPSVLRFSVIVVPIPIPNAAANVQGDLRIHSSIFSLLAFDAGKEGFEGGEVSGHGWAP
jgi:hypothetical protein